MNRREILDLDGLCVLENVLSEEKLHSLSSLVQQRYIDEHIQTIRQADFRGVLEEESPFEILDMNRFKYLMGIEGGLKYPTLHGSLSQKFRGCTAVIDLFQSGPLLEELEDALASHNVFMHMLPAVRVIHPTFDNARVPAHNDLSYNTHFTCVQQVREPFLFLTLWVPVLCEASLDGGIEFFPSLRSTARTFEKDANMGFWLDEGQHQISQHSSFTPNYRTGDAIVFTPDVIHRSKSPHAMSKNFRVSVDVRIFGESTTTSKHYINLRTGQRYGPGSGPCGALNY